MMGIHEDRCQLACLSGTRRKRHQQTPFELGLFFFQAEDGIRDYKVTGVQTCALPILLGGVPLMLGTGIGSEIRQPLGYAIVGGLLVSQVLTLFTTPVVYIYMDRLGHLLRSEERRVGEKGKIRGWPVHLKKKKRVTIHV